MNWDDIKTVVELGLIIVGSGGVTLWIARITNSKKLIELQDRFDLLQIDCDNMKDELDMVKSANQSTYDFIITIEKAVKENEDVAVAMVNWLAEKKEVLKK